MAHATGKVLEEMVEILHGYASQECRGWCRNGKQVLSGPELLEAWLALTTVNCHRNI